MVRWALEFYLLKKYFFIRKVYRYQYPSWIKITSNCTVSSVIGLHENYNLLLLKTRRKPKLIQYTVN